MTNQARRNLFLRCFVAAIFFYLFSLNAACASDKVFMWKVESGQATAYILGTVHMMKKDMYPLDSRIEEAFKRSGAYAIEFNINDAGLLRNDIVSDMVYSGDDNIANHISRETLDLARRKFDGAGLPFDIMSKFKPWFLAMSIELLEYQKLGFDPQYGIDKYFLQKADGKKIIELESFDSQLGLFRAMSDSDQEVFLAYSLKEVDDAKKNADILLRAWSHGDVRAIEHLMFDRIRDDPRLSRLYESLFFERNRNMAEKIAGMLSGRGTYFVAVGAGHLAGRKSIIDILSRKGFSVRQQ